MTASGQVFQILVVGDDDIDRENVKRALDKLDLPIRLQVARDGAQALTMLLKPNSAHYIPPPQLIILDIKMPKMDGIEFLSNLREQSKFRATNVIIFTTSTLARDKMAALKLNVAGYLVKPLKQDEFLPLCRLLLA